LRPTGRDDRVEVLYWSLWAETWKRAGPFGRTVLPLDEALQFIEAEDISSSQKSLAKMQKVRLITDDVQ
jgi:hypothetical protein